MKQAALLFSALMVLFAGCANTQNEAEDFYNVNDQSQVATVKTKYRSITETRAMFVWSQAGAFGTREAAEKYITQLESNNPGIYTTIITAYSLPRKEVVYRVMVKGYCPEWHDKKVGCMENVEYGGNGHE